jgi:signal transduction histidine kinase/tetratricopeptide (TPR) repeat protein
MAQTTSHLVLVLLLVGLLALVREAQAQAQAPLDSAFGQLRQPEAKTVVRTLRNLFDGPFLNRLSSTNHDSLSDLIARRLEAEILAQPPSPAAAAASATRIALAFQHFRKGKDSVGYRHLSQTERDLTQLDPWVLHYYFEQKTHFFRARRRLDSALVYADRSLEQARQLGDQALVLAAYYDLGGTYFGIQDYARARLYHRLVAHHPGTERSLLRTIYNSIALSYQRQASYDSARAYYDTAYRIARQFPQDRIWKAIIQGNIGSTYWLEKKYAKALPYLHYDLANSLAHNRGKVGNNAVTTMGQLATVHLQLGQLDSTGHYLEMARPHLAGDNRAQIRYDFYLTSAQYHQQRGNHRQAYDFLALHLALADSIAKTENVVNAKRLEAEFDLKHQRERLEFDHQKELAVEQATNRQQRWLILLSGLALALLVGLAAVLLRSNQRQKSSNRLLTAQQHDITLKNEALHQANEELKATLDLVAQQKVALSQQTEELADLNQLKDRLFSIISHDLRAPLNALKGTLTLIEMGAVSPEETQWMAKDIGKNLDGVNATLNNLLLWSKSLMSGQPGQHEWIDLPKLVAGKLDLYAAAAQQKQVKLVSEVPDGLQLHTDQHHLRAVLRNLIGNALKFTPEGGQITIGATELATTWRVYVRDTGVGMTAEQLAKLFRKATHFTTWGTQGEKGTGLGLLLCKELVEKDGGRIWAESQPGQGSTFWVELTRAVGEAGG